VNWFLDHDADPNQRCAFQDCTLSIAVRDASLGIIELLFERGESVERGQLLHYAAQRKREDRVEILRLIFAKNPAFIKGIVNKTKEEDNPEDYCRNNMSGLGTPLHFAAREGFLDAVQFLLQIGANAERQDPQGKTAQDWAGYYQRMVVVEELKNARVL
jgi:ankyrin repeat protein